MSGKVLIRPMKPDDLSAVMAIEETCIGNSWSRASMEKELVNPQAHYLSACSEETGEVLGYAGYWQVLDEGHIMNIAVREDLRGRGIGRVLMEEMLLSGDALGILYWTLEVRVSNTPAIRLYERTGFTSAGIRPGYYENPREDANIFWLTRQI